MPRIILLCCLVLALWPLSGSVRAVEPEIAATAEPTVTATAEPDTTVTFARLGVTEKSLRGPFDATYLDFSLPPDWALSGGATLQLQFNTFFARGQSAPAAGGAGTSAGAGASFGGTLRVVLNDTTVATLLLDQSGERTLTVPLPAAALQAVRSDGRQALGLLLDTNEQCGTDQYTSVIIRPSSALALPHRSVAPSTDLGLLPRPIFQRSFEPDMATLVVPDKPSAAELQAALAVAAGFGRMTGGHLELALTPVGKLTQAQRSERHLIVVGRPAAFPLLREAKLPAAPQGDGFAAPDAQPGDGIIQMAASPWNRARVLLVAGGASDAAVLKAGQALSGGKLQSSGRRDLAIVAEVQNQTPPSALSIDRTLADLGYPSQRMAGLGGQYAGYQFELPAGQTVGQEAYLDLFFVHAALLDYDQSSVMVSLNDEPVASVRLDDSSTRLGSARLALPSALFRPGLNQLTVRADLLPRAVCSDPRGGGLWMVIRGESLLHLPLSPAKAGEAARRSDLGRYPLPFSVAPGLGDTAFVLQPDDPAGWEVAGRLAFGLGVQMQGDVADLRAAYADALPADLRGARDLLVIGRPSKLPLIGELGAALPAPFPSGGDIASESGASVSYRVAPGTSVGYLQLLPAPWDGGRMVLAVLGSTDEGLGWAGAALTDTKLRATLSGNLAVVRDQQIESYDTRPKGAAQTGPTPTPAGTPPAAQAAGGRPTILLLGAAAVLGLIALAALVALVVWWRRRRRRAAPAPESQES